jgi:hypothetical protein
VGVLAFSKRLAEKSDSAISKEPADYDDNYSGIIAGQTTEKTDKGLSKQSREPALEGSGTYRTGTAQNKYAAATYNPGIGNDDDNDQSGVGVGHTTEKIQKQYGEPTNMNPALEGSGTYRTR